MSLPPYLRYFVSFRNFLAFWIFGLANNFAYVVMLSAAEDIMSAHSSKRTEVLNETTVIRHIVVCISQAASFLIVALSDSLYVSLLGVVMASAGSGLGESAYIGLSAYYTCDEVIAWSSGTGAAGIAGAAAYALFTEPKLANLSPTITLYIMLVVPVIFLLTYFFILVPAPGLYSVQFNLPSTWIIPKKEIGLPSQETSTAVSGSPSSQNKLCVRTDKESELLRCNLTSTLTKLQLRRSKELNQKTITVSESNAAAEAKLRASQEPHSVKQMYWAALPLLKYMIPLTLVYWAEYLINQGVSQFLVFNCATGFYLSQKSQYRWYQVIYQLGVFVSRSSVNCLQLHFVVLMLLPVIQTANFVFLTFDAVYHFMPHISLTFAVILFEGLLGGSSYVNTFFFIHKEIDLFKKEFSLAVATLADAVGIVLAGFTALPLHNFICTVVRNMYGKE